MPCDEILRKGHEESDSGEEEEPDVVPKVDISKLTPLSPEVISKQVSADHFRVFSLVLRKVLRLP